MMRLVKLGAQVVFRNYIDLASHDFYLRLCDLGFFFEQRNRKKDRWMEKGGRKIKKKIERFYSIYTSAL